MDEQRFLSACRMREEGKLAEAYDEFSKLAQDTEDQIDRAGVLIYAAKTLKILGQYESATTQLKAVRELVPDHSFLNSVVDERLAHLEVYLDFEDADLYWQRGENTEALSRFEAALKKYTQRLHEPRFRGSYEAIQARRAFILADLDRWKEALPILEEIKSSEEFVEVIAFYLGHCYLAAHDYNAAEEKLTLALRLGLPSHLDYRAHCELGMTNYKLKDYAKAKQELEKGAEKADASYIKQSQIWKWLEVTCRSLGLKDEAQHYANLSRPS